MRKCELRRPTDRPLAGRVALRYGEPVMRNPIHIEENAPALAGLLRLLGSTAVALVAGIAVLAVLGWLAPGDFIALAAKALAICTVIAAALAGIARLERRD